MNKKIESDIRFSQQKFYIKIRELYKNNKYKEFIKESSEYLNYFPNDTHARFMRSKIYRKLNRFEEAINDLKYILSIEDSEHSLTSLYFIYYYLNMYDEALKLLPILYEKRCINAHSVSISELVMKKHLGMDINLKKGARCDYIKEQIIKYDEEVAFNHIVSHREEKLETKSIFNNDIDLKYLFNLIRNSINNKNKVNTEEMLEIHYFGISNVGLFNDIGCNYIKVVVVPNTNNIITMYPVLSVDSDYISDINIDYEKLFKNRAKEKTLSRIDKFNKRYNLNKNTKD